MTKLFQCQCSHCWNMTIVPPETAELIRADELVETAKSLESAVYSLERMGEVFKAQDYRMAATFVRMRRLLLKTVPPQQSAEEASEGRIPPGSDIVFVGDNGRITLVKAAIVDRMRMEFNPDWVAARIREFDGNHDKGAGAIGEYIALSMTDVFKRMGWTP